MLTTGQAARMCGCSPGTIIKWYDSGLITGTRLPGSRYRKINEQSLRSFALENGIEFTELKDLECPKNGTKPSQNSRPGYSRLPRRRTRKHPG